MRRQIVAILLPFGLPRFFRFPRSLAFEGILRLQGTRRCFQQYAWNLCQLDVARLTASGKMLRPSGPSRLDFAYDNSSSRLPRIAVHREDSATSQRSWEYQTARAFRILLPEVLSCIRRDRVCSFSAGVLRLLRTLSAEYLSLVAQ